MDDHVDEIMELIGERIIETKVVGIHGMGGVGKTTLATIIYNKLSAHSTNCCFLSDCKDKEVAILQKQLIFDILKESVPIRNRAEGITAIKERLSSKKVVLLLDDVMEKTQLDALVGMGKCWFDRGSKVIITTRDEEVLKHVDVKYKLTEMDFNHSLILFSRHAFNNDHPPAEYFDLSKNAVNICGRLPLALEIIGSLLAKEDRNFWGTTLKKLKSIPDKGVEKRLNINIEALDQPARKIFLDVCCFFVGFDVRIVSHMWESYGFHPRYYLHILQKMSLIEITKHKQLWMHDIIRDIGQNFVRKNADYKPEKQSRVWDHEKSIDVLEIKEGRENVEAIRLRFDRQFQDFIEKEESIGLSKLRFLQVDCVDLDESNSQHFPSPNLCQRNQIMLPNLIMLSWHNFPVYFKFTTICFKKLMILDLSRSQITDEWEGWNHLKMTKNLKVLNLTGCGNLHRTLDLSAHENLEQLILQGCTKLVEVHRSIGMLKHLVLLNLKYCEKLQTLPDEMEEMEDLRELLLDGTSITKIHEWNGMKKLETLSAASCRLLSELPLGNFGSLVKLDLSYSSIRELPDSIETMKNLRILRIFDAMLEKLPSALGKLERLEEFYANSFGSLSGKNPSEIGRLSLEKLEKIHASSCRYLSGEIPKYQSPSHPTPSLNWIGGLRKLESLGLYCDDLVTLPLDFNLLSKLRKLQLLANNLECLPKLPQNLSYFHFDGRGLMEKSINLSYWEKLSELKLSYCEQLKEIRVLEPLKSLRLLTLWDLPSPVKLPDLTGLKKLQHLWINDCPKLVEVRGQQESLGSFLLERCQSLEQLPDPLSFKHIQVYIIRSCRKVKEIQGPETSENLGWLQLADLPLLEKLPDLTNAKELRLLFLECCPHLVEIPGWLESLRLLGIIGCGSLHQFSDPLSLMNLEDVIIKE
ncbi:hypothetical protein EUGRSUZ_J01336, partial [Eucalyptus grandis]